MTITFTTFDKVKIIATGTVGSVGVGLTAATLWEQRQTRLQEKTAQDRESNSRRLIVTTGARIAVRDGIMSTDEVLPYCSREGILTRKECLGPFSGHPHPSVKSFPIDEPEAEMFSPENLCKGKDNKSSRKGLRGGGSTENNPENVKNKNSYCNKTETSIDRYSSGIAGIAVDPTPRFIPNRENTFSSGTIFWISSGAFLLGYSIFSWVRIKNEKMKNFFKSDSEKILDNQSEMKHMLSKIFENQEKIIKKLP